MVAIKRDVTMLLYTIKSDVADNLTQSKFTFKKDTSVEEGSTTCATRTVCLVQATRIPARHKK